MAWNKETKATNGWTKISKQVDEILGWGLDQWGIGPYGSPIGGSIWTKETKATDGWIKETKATP